MFKSLGISEKRFSQLIVHSHNAIKLNALLDGLKLDIYSEEATAINVEKDIFFDAKKLFSFDFSVLENKTTGVLKFNDEYFLNMMNTFKSINGGSFTFDNFCQYVNENYHPEIYYCIEIVNKVYLVHNEEQISLHNVLWISFK